MELVRVYVEEVASDDVRATLAWLDEAGFRLTASGGGRGESFGNALLVFSASTEVWIRRDRSQWFMDIALAPGTEAIQYDLLLAAQRGQAYWDCFPQVGAELGHARQLPPGVSWRHTLPKVLAWIGREDVSTAVARASDQRYALMWPESHKAKQLRRSWRAQGLPLPPGRLPDKRSGATQE